MWKLKFVLIFLITFLLCGLIGIITIQNRSNTENERVERLILEHSNKLNDVISKQLYKTQALAALVVRGDGTVDNFQKTASVLASDIPTLANFLLAPDGVVTDIYPLEGNEAALGLDFFNEAGHAGNKEAILARDTGELVMAGPFMLRQGIMGLTGRYPVYIDSGSEDLAFWGLVSVSLKFPEALDDTGLSMLENQNLFYELWRTDPDTLERQVIASNIDQSFSNTEYLERPVNIHNAQWYFRIYITGSWYEYPETWFSFLAALSVSLFIAFIMQSKIVTEQNAARAREATHAKSKFLAFMSHEMRTPMNAIIGISGIELENETHTPDVRDAFGKINKSGRTFLGLINDILDLSKAETGKLEVVPVKYETAGLISDTALLNAILIGDKPVKLVVKADENLPLVLIGDDLRIRQILNNILSNAIKYTDEGTVTLTVACDNNYGYAVYSDNVASVDSYGYAAYNDKEKAKDVVNLIFTIEDTGQGLTGEQLATLYDEYAMFNKDTNRKTEGSGLGMSITKKLVDLMNGRIEAKSEAGAGSTFTVILPQEPVNTTPIGKELAASLSNLKLTPDREKKKLIHKYMPDCKVLIVDDIAENIFVAKGLMKPYGLQADSAESGFEALEKVRAGNIYDIIFMDHMMPEMDGIETVKILREEGYVHPVIALTANVVAGIKETYIENGFDDFLPKPFDTIELDGFLKKYRRSEQTRALSPVTRLKEISCLDVDAALNTIGNMEDIYIDTVKITAKMMPERIENIDKYLSGDIESFKIEIHGIKSVLINIGAYTLSIHATQLERAAAHNDIIYINKNYPAFHTGLIELSDALNEALQPERYNTGDTAGTVGTTNKSLSPETLFEVKKAVEDFDSILALDILSPYSAFTYNSQTDELLKIIVFSLETSDYESALENLAVMEGLLSG